MRTTALISVGILLGMALWFVRQRSEPPPPSAKNAAHKRSATPEPAVVVAPTPAVPATAPGPDASPTPDAPADADARLRRMTEARYRPFYDRMGLQPDVAQRVTERILKRRRAELEAVAAAHAVGGDLNGLEVKRQSLAAQARLEEELQAEFGETFVSEYRRFEWLLAAQGLVGAAEPELRAKAPLTPVQREQLVALLSQSQGTSSGAIVRLPHDPVAYRLVLTEELMRSIETILSPAQRAPFQRVHALQFGTTQGRK